MKAAEERGEWRELFSDVASELFVPIRRYLTAPFVSAFTANAVHYTAQQDSPQQTIRLVTLDWDFSRQFFCKMMIAEKNPESPKK